MVRDSTVTTVGDAVRARIDLWPYDADVAHLVLLDHHMVPTCADVDAWIHQAYRDRTGVRAIRTGAMFPDAREVFAAAGFTTIDTLALLDIGIGTRASAAHRSRQRRTPFRRRDSEVGTRRMRASDLAAVAALDRMAFGDPWGNDVRSLTDITNATPRHRARVIEGAGGLEAMAISGQSGSFGYLQRLAVHPDARRRGHAKRLVLDGLRWMEQRGATTALVNTGVANDAALGLYRDLGFTRRSETLQILEHVVA